MRVRAPNRVRISPERLRRMRLFAGVGRRGAGDYRLNPETFYLKFVKRDGARNTEAPLEHFELLARSRELRGPQGGVRVSYKALAGHYLRHTPFVDLVRAG